MLCQFIIAQSKYILKTTLFAQKIYRFMPSRDHDIEWSVSIQSHTDACLVPADVAEAVEPGLCVLAWTGRVKTPLAGLIEQRSVIVPVFWVVQLHVHHTAGRAVPLSVLLLVEY